MKHILRILTYFSIFSIILLASCSKKPTNLKHCPALSSDRTVQHVRDNLIFSYEVLLSHQSKEYFGVDLPASDYYPVHLSFVNTSAYCYTIRPSYINTSLASPQKISKLLHYNTSLYVLTASWPALLFFWQLIPVVIAPTGYAMSKNNKKITHYIRRNSLHGTDTLDIAPYARVDKFIFIKAADLRPDFTIRVLNEDTKELLLFTVSMGEVFN